MFLIKKEIAQYISANHNIGKKDAENIVDDVFNRIADELASAEGVNIHNFGKFSVTIRNARKGRNPVTGEEISIPAKKAVQFKPSKTLKEQDNA